MGQSREYMCTYGYVVSVWHTSHNHINPQKKTVYICEIPLKIRTNHMNLERPRTGEILTIFFCWCRTNKTRQRERKIWKKTISEWNPVKMIMKWLHVSLCFPNSPKHCFCVICLIAWSASLLVWQHIELISNDFLSLFISIYNICSLLMTNYDSILQELILREKKTNYSKQFKCAYGAETIGRNGMNNSWNRKNLTQNVT